MLLTLGAVLQSSSRRQHLLKTIVTVTEKSSITASQHQQDEQRGRRSVCVSSRTQWHLKCHLSNQRHWSQTSASGQSLISVCVMINKQYVFPAGSCKSTETKPVTATTQRGRNSVSLMFLGGGASVLQLNDISVTHETDNHGTVCACQNSTTSMLPTGRMNTEQGGFRKTARPKLNHVQLQ